MKRKDLVLMTLLAALLVAAACGQKGDSGETASSEDGPAVEAGVDELVWRNYEDGLATAGEEGKYLLIDFWNGWCHWCKVMERETYADEEVKRRLRENFVLVKVDTESKLAQGDGPDALTGHQIARRYRVSSFPTTWFIDPEGEQIGAVPGFVDPGRFALLLDWLTSKAYRTQNFQEYQTLRVGS